MKRILFVEDNVTVVEGIKYLLENEKFIVDFATTINKAKSLLEINSYDLILLDVILTDGNGLDFYESFKIKYKTPVIFLTAKDSEEDIMRGLELGAEDYIIKSFRMKELIFRIKKIVYKYENDSVIRIGNFKFDENNNVAYKNNKPIILTALEHRLLGILISNIGKLVTREYLLSQIWDISENFVNDNTLTVYMKRLREKIEDKPENPQIIKTVRGGGYKIEKESL